MDPTTIYTDLALIAEGESGPMFAGKHATTNRLVREEGSTQVKGIVSLIPNIKKVAIKKIPRTAEKKLNKIRNELTIMKMSRHPNVVEYFGCYKTDNDIWVKCGMIMERFFFHSQSMCIGCYRMHGCVSCRYHCHPHGTRQK